MSELTRREALVVLGSAGATSVTLGAGVSGCRGQETSAHQGNLHPNPGDLVSNPAGSSHDSLEHHASQTVVVREFALGQGRPWPTPDPFLFAVHHNDQFPRGNGTFGPATSLAGRQLGMDFAWKDGWNMYHGREVPGFPAHPHRGFETVTVVRSGRLDHADSLGAAARYGDGDVQWLTAGAGIQHAEMFPLLAEDQDNPLDLFQIWLNLPKKSKMVPPYFAMLWADTIPRVEHQDGQGHKVEIEIRAGALGSTRAPNPPPDSWAADPHNEVTILTGKMEPGAQFLLPATSAGVNRSLYFFSGDKLTVGDKTIDALQGVELAPQLPVFLSNGSAPGEFLLLQGRPINEPVAQHGPFVMNTRQELEEAYRDYQRTQFGGWPWDRHDPVHGKDPARFARRPDGSTERPEEKAG